MDFRNIDSALPPGLGPRLTPARGAQRVATEADPAAQGLSDEEKREVARLKERDAEVRRHEAAHVAAAGRYARGGASFEYTRGPDGRLYANGGEVSIDVSKESTPEATLEKAGTVRRAALAPAEPSPQDRNIAAQAGRLETTARRELAQEQREKADSAAAPTPLENATPAPEPAPKIDIEGYTGQRHLDLRG